MCMCILYNISSLGIGRDPTRDDHKIMKGIKQQNAEEVKKITKDNLGRQRIPKKHLFAKQMEVCSRERTWGKNSGD